MKKYLYYFLWGIVLVTISLLCLLIYFLVSEPAPDSRFLGLIYTFIAVIGLPIGLGGWLFIWGDNGPPLFLENFFSQLVLGLILWFLVGLVLGFIYKKIRKKYL